MSSTERMKQALHCGLLLEADVEPHGRVERRHLVQQDVRQLVLEGVGVLVASRSSRRARPQPAIVPATRPIICLTECSRAGRAELPAEVLLGDDVRRVLRPALGELDVALLEGDAVAVADARVAQLPLDGVERMRPRGREEALDRQRAAGRCRVRDGGVRGCVHRTFLLCCAGGAGGHSKLLSGVKHRGAPDRTETAARNEARNSTGSTLILLPPGSRSARNAPANLRPFRAQRPSRDPVAQFRPRRRRAEAGLGHRVAQREQPVRLERAAARERPGDARRARAARRARRSRSPRPTGRRRARPRLPLTRRRRCSAAVWRSARSSAVGRRPSAPCAVACVVAAPAPSASWPLRRRGRCAGRSPPRPAPSSRRRARRSSSACRRRRCAGRAGARAAGAPQRRCARRARRRPRRSASVRRHAANASHARAGAGREQVGERGQRVGEHRRPAWRSASSTRMRSRLGARRARRRRRRSRRRTRSSSRSRRSGALAALGLARAPGGGRDAQQQRAVGLRGRRWRRR